MTPITARADDETPVWHVLIKGETYGGYTTSQIIKFMNEGRIKPQTRIAQGNGAEFLTIAATPVFADAVRALAREERDTPLVLNTPVARGTATAPMRDSANFLVVAESPLPVGGGLEDMLAEWGEVFTPFPGTCILRARASVGDLRKALGDALGDDHRFLIVDASRDRLAWTKLGAEGDRAMRATWNAKLTD